VKTLPLLAGALAAVSLTATAADAPPPAEHKALNTSGAMFGVREAVQQIDLSPSGQRLVYIAPGSGRISTAYVVDLVAGGAPRIVVQTAGAPERLSWCGFVTDDRLICSASATLKTADGILVGMSRMIATDDTGKNMRELGQRRSEYAGLSQFDTSVIDWLPNQPGNVLMARTYTPEEGKMGTRMVRNESGLGIDRLDVSTMKFTRVEAPTEAASGFLTDGNGNVRIKFEEMERGGTSQLSGRVVYSYRLPGSTDWLKLGESTGTGALVPIAVDATSNSAYVLKPLDGRDALYRVKLDGTLATELVFKHDKVDVDDVVRIGRSGRVIGVTYATDKRHIEYFDPEYARLAAALGKAIPSLPQIGFDGASSDQNILLVHAGSDSDPGRFYVFDKTKKSLNEIMLARPQLENVTLSSVKPVTYAATDGTAIPGYLTLPPGKTELKGLPAVVLPHGGPSARDEWGFDWLAQFLAHEGFAVLQPNYRGSAGFGDAWLVENGFKSWKTSIGDVVDAGKWMVAQGADPAQLSIVGWSYGGYAALQSGVVEPSLFRHIVAIAPVTDLQLVKDEARLYTNWELVTREIGDGPHVQAGSPLRNASAITAPVLLFHGTTDGNVGVAHSRKMDDALKAAGKHSELMVFEGLEHSLPDSNARAYMLDRIAAFLKSGGGAAP
jgi:dipeptidyl aminopeptidase/acylaminoacyl peptidase